MLVLTRKTGQSFVIGHNVVVTVNKTSRGRVRLSIDAPQQITIQRGEIVEPAGMSHRPCGIVDKPKS